MNNMLIKLEGGCLCEDTQQEIQQIADHINAVTIILSIKLLSS